MKYPWAANTAKLTRAIGVVGEKDEAKLQAEYIKIGGRVVGDIIKKTPEIASAAERIQEPTEPIVKPKRVYKKRKNVE